MNGTKSRSIAAVGLADFIVNNLESILQEWQRFAAAAAPSAAGMTDTELRDHASVMLQAIAEDLRHPQTPREQEDKSKGLGHPGRIDEAGGEHGASRRKSDFTVEQLVSEYRALRASVLRLWSAQCDSASQSELQDMTRFNEAIDQLLIASVGRFADESRDALAGERRRRDEFLAMLGHELRNPLAPIASAAALLTLGGNDSIMAKKATDIIERQVKHMTGLIDDLLDVSRVTRGLIELKTEALDLQAVVLDAAEQAMPLIEARGHQLVVQEPADAAIVTGDPKRLVQIVSNLLSNAAKYTPNGGRIVVKLEVHGEHVTVAVQDNGIGMTPDLIEHLFEPFVQAARTSDRASGGLGLGLALVKSLTGLHGGKVACASAGPGRGSEFTVSLPRAPGDTGQAARAPAG